MTPSDDDIDSLFAELTDELEEGMNLPLEGDIEDLSQVSVNDLHTRYVEITAEIVERREVLHPHTQTGRDLHAMRYAVQMEMKRRGVPGIGLGT